MPVHDEIAAPEVAETAVPRRPSRLGTAIIARPAG